MADKVRFLVPDLWADHHVIRPRARCWWARPAWPASTPARPSRRLPSSTMAPPPAPSQSGQAAGSRRLPAGRRASAPEDGQVVYGESDAMWRERGSRTTTTNPLDQADVRRLPPLLATSPLHGATRRSVRWHAARATEPMSEAAPVTTCTPRRKGHITWKDRKPQKSIDPAALEVLDRAQTLGLSTAFTPADAMKPCPIGEDGACCKNCYMGPCRLVKPGAARHLRRHHRDRRQPQPGARHRRRLRRPLRSRARPGLHPAGRGQGRGAGLRGARRAPS